MITVSARCIHECVLFEKSLERRGSRGAVCILSLVPTDLWDESYGCTAYENIILAIAR